MVTKDMIELINQKIKELCQNESNVIESVKDDQANESRLESDPKSQRIQKNKRTILPETRAKPDHNKLTCKICKKSFKRHDFLRNHLRAMECQNQSLLEIEEIVIDEESAFEENKIDSIEDALAKSQEEFLGSKPAKVPKLDLVQGEKEIQIIASFQCRKCPAKFENQLSFSEHVISEHNKMSCNVCQVEFAGSSALKRHVSRNHLKDFLI